MPNDLEISGTALEDVAKWLDFKNYQEYLDAMRSEAGRRRVRRLMETAK